MISSDKLWIYLWLLERSCASILSYQYVNVMQPGLKYCSWDAAAPTNITNTGHSSHITYSLSRSSPLYCFSLFCQLEKPAKLWLSLSTISNFAYIEQLIWSYICTKQRPDYGICCQMHFPETANLQIFKSKVSKLYFLSMY